jgi:hypothetical protein
MNGESFLYHKSVNEAFYKVIIQNILSNCQSYNILTRDDNGTFFQKAIERLPFETIKNIS